MPMLASHRKPIGGIMTACLLAVAAAMVPTVNASAAAPTIADQVFAIALAADYPAPIILEYSLEYDLNPQCLDDTGWSGNDGTVQQTWQCTDSNGSPWVPGENKVSDLDDNQTWDLSGGSSTIAIQNDSSGLCLDDTNWSKTPGTPIQQWDCTGAKNQAWDPIYYNDGWVLKNVFSKMCLTVPASYGNGSKLIQWPCQT